MMGGHRVDHVFRFAVTLDDVRPNNSVRTFHLVIDRFADVMQKARALGRDQIETQLRRQGSPLIGRLQSSVGECFARNCCGNGGNTRSLINSMCMGARPSFRMASSPARSMNWSISCETFDTTSSIRAG